MAKITVNGEPITDDMIQYEVERLIRFHAEHGMSQEQIRAQLKEIVAQATEQAIGEKLLMEDASKLDFPISAEEIDDHVETVIETFGGKANFDRALAERGISLSQFKANLRCSKKTEQLLLKITEGVADPTEAEIEKHFNDHRDEYTKGEQVLASHILISPDGETQVSKDEARAKIEAIRKSIVEDGVDFSEAAQKNSMCPSSQQGGSLGWFSRGMMVPEFDSAAFSMKDGEISEIVETQFGYHIIKKVGSKAAGVPQFTEVREQIRDFLRHDRRGRAISNYVEELKSKATIVRE